VFRAQAAIVTVPLGVLKSGGIAFGAPLSEAKRTAIARLGMGALSKTVLRFPRRFLPADIEILARVVPASSRAQWAESFDVGRVVGANALVMFNAGAFARAVEAMSDEAAVRAASSALQATFGGAFVPPEAALHTHWSSDPFARGAYSFVAVGSSLADRKALAAREGALFFAGEATSSAHAATVHGAYTSGEVAAAAVLRG
jgi:monoamine oxidase